MFPLISVVVPTIGRPSVHRAVDSALQQIGVDVEVLVVVNNTDQFPEFTDQRVKVIDGNSTPGQGLARSLGVSFSKGDLIALLDDDDYWEPDKCLIQLETVLSLRGSLEGNWIAASGLTIHYPDGHQQNRPRKHRQDMFIEDPIDYLFVRRQVGRVDNFLQASSLVFPKTLALSTPFDSVPQMHEDWGWILESKYRSHADIVLVAPYLTHYDVSAGGLASTNRYKKSIDWADFISVRTTRRAVGDFLLTVSLAMAARAGDLDGALSCISAAAKKGRPGLPAMVLATRSFLLGVGRRLAHSMSKK